MVLIIIFVAAAIAMAVASVRAKMREEKQKKLFHSQFRPYVSDFSVADYMGRIEQAAIETMKEAEKAQKYQLVLWAGLDGLRLNEDGTSTWIRLEEKTKPVSVSYSLHNQLLNVSRETMQNPFSGCQNITAQINSQIWNQTCQIDNSIRMMQMQIAQNQNMISAIHPAYMPAYTPYYHPTYYSAVNQCCARQ